MRVLTAIAASVLAVSGCSRGSDEPSEQASSNEAPAAGVAATATAAAAANPLGKAVSGARARKIMHDRHEAMEDIGDADKLVSSELKKDSPDLAKVRSGAAVFTRYAPQVKGWFPPGTVPAGGKSRAKPEIWARPADFRAKAIAFEKTAKAFSAAARGTDIAAMRSAHADLGKSCKACHDPYRAPEDH